MLSKEIVSLGLGLELASASGSSPVPQLAADVAEQVRFLLRGFALHAQAGEPADRLAFQNALNEAADSLGTGSSTEDLRRAVAKALKAERNMKRAVQRVWLRRRVICGACCRR